MFENFSQIPKDFESIFLKKKVKDCVREFGLLLFIVGSLVGLYTIYYRGFFSSGLLWILAGAASYILGRIKPRALFPFWRLWMMLGLVLNKFLSPVVLFLLWILVVTPTSFFLKLIGKKIFPDNFRDSSITSYYIDRSSKDNDFQLLKRQF
jgi:Saxitoxin biosynthesis operon protein SxtJ